MSRATDTLLTFGLRFWSRLSFVLVLLVVLLALPFIVPFVALLLWLGALPDE